MAASPLRGGRGSNQYVTRGAPSAPRESGSGRAIAAALTTDDAVDPPVYRVIDRRDRALPATDPDGKPLVFPPAWPVPPIDEEAYALRERLERGATLTAEQWVAAAHHLDESIRRECASRDDCPPELFEQLALRSHPKDLYDQVRYAACANPNCPPEVLAVAVLTVDRSNTAVAAAKNRNTPVDAIRVRAREHNNHVGLAIAEREDLPDDIHLINAANCQIDGARTWTPYLRRADCPVEILERMGERATHPSWEKSHRWAQHALVKHPRCPPQVLDRLSGVSDTKVRCLVAERTDASPLVQQRLAESGDQDVGRSLAANPSATPAALEAVYYHGDRLAQKTVIEHPNCPEHIRVGHAFGDNTHRS